jgi:large subunit ribosomal protein L9
MDIILLTDVAKVGKKFDVVSVSEGYAINFLIPRGLAQAATPSARKSLAEHRSREAAQEHAHASALARDIAAVDGKKVTLKERVNEHGHLFGALHADAITDAVYNQLGVTLPKEALVSFEPIKTAGEIKLPIAAAGARGTLTLSIEAAQ